ncbi:MAG: serine/threonine-protein kinase, partial [Kofleriaceae bacterium]|nr:serine/threonine-protein kinase [Kofleriaceae bacterium]
MSTPTAELETPLDADLEVGARVGEYEVDGKLGQGAFGSVFRAVHPVIGKVVAIKVLARRFSVDPEMVSRFMAEARAVNQIRHRHIIDIFSYGTLEDGRLYYVMEYLDGEPLDALIEREQRIPVADALAILRGIAKALDAAHAKGVAHRDLKAENVFLGRDSDGGVFPKLLDFGIAKLMGSEDALKHKTRTGAPIGTPYYMSPEQCRGRDVDHRTDLYAFGVLTYFMLTGVFPHDAEDYMSILMKQVAEEPAPPSVHNGELTPAIDEAIAWLMKKDPAQRPPDLKTAMQALEQAAVNAGLADASTRTWDAQTGPVKTHVPNVATPAPTRLGNIVTSDTVAAFPRQGSRARMFAVVGALAVIAAGAVLFVLAQRTKDTPAQTLVEPAKPAEPAPPPPTPPAPIKEVPVVDPPEAQTVIVTITGVPD